MNAFSNCIRTAIYNISHNKTYALFSLLGTAFTFVFIIILLQLVHIVTGNEPPLENADRTIRIEWFYGDTGPDHAWNKKYYLNEPDVIQLGNTVQGYEIYGISHTESINPLINGQLKTVTVNFVNPGYWQVKGFNFIAGRPFTDEDYSASTPVAVIKENNARKYFGSPFEAMDKELEFQGNTYRIIGVVEDFSVLSADEWSGIWVPHKYNKGIPSGWMNYAIEYLFPETMSPDEMTDNVWRAVKYHFDQQEKEIIEPTELRTSRKLIAEKLGGNLLRYGVIVILLTLLIIPAINIVTLNTANADKRSGETAIQRALGASKSQAFFQIMLETVLLVLLGTLLGLLLSFPVLNVIENYFLDYGTGEDSKLLGRMDYGVFLLGVLPVSVVFAFMTGAIPAAKISRCNISSSLKGDTGEIMSQPTNKNRGFMGIYIEQVLIFVLKKVLADSNNK
jgi:hypothetical protein